MSQIPSIGVHKELLKLFEVYGKIEDSKMLDEYPCEQLYETILIKFEKIQNARVAKIKLDDYNFYGGSLHVFYAPEYETIDDLKDKLNERKEVISQKCKKYEQIGFGTLEYDMIQKKKQTLRFENKNFKGNKKKIQKKLVQNVNESTVYGPQLPEGWVKETITGNQSYDETVKEIRFQLRASQPVQQETSDEVKKRRKKIKL